MPVQCLHAKSLQEVYMKKSLLFVVCVFLALAPTAFAVGQAEVAPQAAIETADAYPQVVVDDQGTTITLESKPERILSVMLMTDEILLALAEKRSLIGVSSFCQDPAVSNVAALVFDIPNKVVLNVELFISLEPDLIFVGDWTEAESVEQLRQAGLTVFVVKTPTTIAGIRQAIVNIGEVIGQQAKAQEIVSWMDDRLRFVGEKVAALPQSERLSVMDYGVWGDAMGSGSTWDEIIQNAGLINAVGHITADQWGRVPISKEKLIEIDPDILVLPGWVYNDPGGPDAFFTQVISDPAFRDLKAVQNESVFRLPESHRSTTSQYIVYGVEDLARLAYPDLFK